MIVCIKNHELLCNLHRPVMTVVSALTGFHSLSKTHKQLEAAVSHWLSRGSAFAHSLWADKDQVHRTHSGGVVPAQADSAGTEDTCSPAHSSVITTCEDESQRAR